MARYGRNSLNLICLSGEVVDVGTAKLKNSLVMRARLKLSCLGKCVYIDAIGFGRIAQIMSITCDIGNQIYVEGKFANALISRNKGSRKIAPYIHVTSIECLSRHAYIAKVPHPTVIELLDLCDPIGYLDNSIPKNRQRREKNG